MCVFLCFDFGFPDSWDRFVNFHLDPLKLEGSRIHLENHHHHNPKFHQNFHFFKGMIRHQISIPPGNLVVVFHLWGSSAKLHVQEKEGAMTGEMPPLMSTDQEIFGVRLLLSWKVVGVEKHPAFFGCANDSFLPETNSKFAT